MGSEAHPGLTWQVDPATVALRRPALLVALHGWFDLGNSATAAVTALSQPGGHQLLGLLDAEEYVDLGAHRPTIRYDDDGRIHVTWPHTHLAAVRTGRDHDLVTATGQEPDHRWRAYADSLLAVARALRCELVVTVGAAPGQVPHTRPLPVTVSASTPALARRLGLSLPSYQGPTGVAGVLQDRLAAAGLPGISVRVAVPSYLGSLDQNPQATQALVQRLADLLGLAVPPEDPAVGRWLEEVDLAVARNPEVRGYVANLERRFDAASALPDVDRLVDELERYLREHRDEP